MTYRFLSPALMELREASTYYEAKVAGLGAEFFDEVEAAIDRILRFPDAWGNLSNDFRHCNLRRFPYTLVYTRLSRDQILIVSIFHQSREPDSWRRQL